MATSAVGETMSTRNILHRTPLVKRLKKMRNNEQYTDVTLMSGDFHMPCHRVVLEAASPYFTAMFSSGLEESTSAKVQMTIDPDVLFNIVDYVYGADVEITVNNAERLVEACDFLLLEDLKTRCQEFMVGQVESSNCIRFFRFAKLYRLELLQVSARRVMLKEFKSVSYTTEFKEMSFGELIEYISDDEVNFEVERVMLEAVHGWVRHDPQQRQPSLEAILEHVRLPNCPTSAIKYGDMLRLVVIGGLTKDKLSHRSCEYLKSDGDSWQMLSELPQSVSSRYSVCQVANGLLLTGGDVGGVYVGSNQCWLFDTVVNKWTKTASLITPRYSHGSAALNNAVYVLGGIGNTQKPLAAVERFDLKLHHWTVVPDMAHALSQLMVIGYGNDIYAIGGLVAKGSFCRSVRLYDTKSGVWRRLTDMPKPCHGGAVVTMQNYIYVVGGYPCSCLRYDPATDNWSKLQKPRLQHSFAPAVAWHGRMLLAGGVNNEDISTSVIEQYDPVKDEWSTWHVQLRRETERHSLFKLYIQQFSCDTSTASQLRSTTDWYCDSFNERVVKLRYDEQCTDVTLQSGDVRMPCHRVVLAASCQYFNTIFSSELAEANSGSVRIEVDPSTMVNVVDYIYTDEVDISTDNVQNLVAASDLFQLDQVSAACQRFMETQLQPCNCIGFYTFAKFYALDDLRLSAKRIMHKEFVVVVSTVEFAEMTCSELIEYIDDDDINVKDEDAVMDAVLTWVRHDLDTRQSDLPMVLEHVRLCYCTSHNLSLVLKYCDFLSSVCRCYLEDALAWHGILGRQSHRLISAHAVARTKFTVRRLLVVVGGLTKDAQHYRDCHVFNSAYMPKYWVKLTQLPYTSSKFYSVCHVADGLLLTGAGYCYFYNMVGQRWDLLGSLLTPRFRHGSVAVGDVVYILGGTDDDVGTLESVERLDKVRLCRPLFVADMPQPVTHPMAVSYVEGFYVFGGIDADNATSRCSRYYDVKCDTWRTVAEMPEECRLGAAVAGIDCIYVVGGSTRSCLLFNPATDSWTRLCPPLNAHGNAPAVGWNNRILLAGGDDDEVTSAVEQYDTVKDEWSVWEPPLMQRLSCHFLFNIVSNTTSSADGLPVKQRDCFRGDAYRIL